MKNKIVFVLSLILGLALSGCSKNQSSITSEHIYPSEEGETSQSATLVPSIIIPDAAGIEDPSNSGDFVLTTSNGTFTNEGNIYTITKAGSYSATGVLNGQLIINAGDDDEVEIALNNATFIYDKDSPIKAINADKVEISAKSDTKNLVKDNRAHKVAEDSTVGEGAINSKVDLKLKGNGLLVVYGNFNNAIHTTDDLKIQNLTLKAVGYNNALKGNDSVTISSGTIYAISQNGQGIKTKNSDVSSKGNQRGTIEIDGGTVYVDSVYDGIDASYNVVINQTSTTTPTEIVVKTGKNSSYSKNYDNTSSSKAIKAENLINIKNGTIVLSASDDAIHANYGETLENGSKGVGNIEISGGAISIASGDDGIHADNTLTISGGNIVITGAKEGLEANHIKISGGETHVYGTDDGVNASKKINETPTVEVSGGFLDVSVSNGDTDGIDSNGSFSQTGGVVISRGSPGTNASGMSTGLDCDGTASITGGTFIAFNGMEKTPSTGNNVNKAITSNATGQGGRPGPGGPGGGPGRGGLTASSFAAGNYKLSGSGLEIDFVNNYLYGSFIIYSSNMSLNNEYTLSCEGTAVLSWNQSTNSVTIS